MKSKAEKRDIFGLGTWRKVYVKPSVLYPQFRRFEERILKEYNHSCTLIENKNILQIVEEHFPPQRYLIESGGMGFDGTGFGKWENDYHFLGDCLSPFDPRKDIRERIEKLSFGGDFRGKFLFGKHDEKPFIIATTKWMDYFCGWIGYLFVRQDNFPDYSQSIKDKRY